MLFTRFLRQELRTMEVRLMALALFLALTIVAAQEFFTTRISASLREDLAANLGADLIVQSNTPMADTLLAPAKKMALTQTNVVEVTTMLESDSQLKLVNLKAVEDGYPLRGNIKVQSHGQSSLLPVVGALWAEDNLFPTLNLKLGDHVTIGQKEFILSGKILAEPDHLQDWLSLAPRVMIRAEDLPATQIVAIGSRVLYEYQFAGSLAALKEFAADLQPQLKLGQRLVSPQTGRMDLRNFWETAQRYLRLSSLLILLLAGAGIALACRHFVFRQARTVALLKCLGVTHRRMMRWYFSSLATLVSVIIVAAFLTGIGVAEFFGFILARHYHFTLVRAWSFSPFITTVAVGYLFLFGFIFPALLGLRNHSPLQIWRYQQMQNSQLIAFSFFSMALTLMLLVVWFSADFTLTRIVIGYGTLLLMSIYFSAYVLCLGLRWLSHRVHGLTRYAMANVVRIPTLAALEITGFSIAFFVVMVMIQLRYDLVQTWEVQIPRHAPNYFVINIQPGELLPAQNFFKSVQDKFPATRVSEFYPIVRGRLMAKNGIDILDAVPATVRSDNSLHRDLNFSWHETLPMANHLESGTLWEPGMFYQVSVEDKLANRLHLNIGDELTFQIAEQIRNARITSLRSVDWNSLKPNFFYLFPPGALSDFPHTFMTSFYLPPEAGTLLANFARQFPAVTIYPVANIVSQVKSTLVQVQTVVNGLVMVMFAAAVLILLAVLQVSFHARSRELALLRAMGLTKRALFINTGFEFAWLGGLAAGLSWCAATTLTWRLTDLVFGLRFSPNFTLLVAGLILGAILLSGVGCLALRRLHQQSPSRVLAASFIAT